MMDWLPFLISSRRISVVAAVSLSSKFGMRCAGMNTTWTGGGGRRGGYGIDATLMVVATQVLGTNNNVLYSTSSEMLSRMYDVAGLMPTGTSRVAWRCFQAYVSRTMEERRTQGAVPSLVYLGEINYK